MRTRTVSLESAGMYLFGDAGHSVLGWMFSASAQTDFSLSLCYSEMLSDGGDKNVLHFER